MFLIKTLNLDLLLLEKNHADTGVATAIAKPTICMTGPASRAGGGAPVEVGVVVATDAGGVAVAIDVAAVVGMVVGGVLVRVVAAVVGAVAVTFVLVAVVVVCAADKNR